MASEVRVRIVSALLLTLTILSPLKIGADSAEGPCLSASSRRESAAWSAYAKGLYGILAERDMAAGRERIHQALLLDPGNGSLRDRWLSVFNEGGRNAAAASTKYREIYAAAPLHVDNVLTYASLLWRGGKKGEAREVLKGTLEKLDWREGVLLCYYAVVAEDDCHDALPALIRRARESDECSGRWALDVCEALYWDAEWHRNLARLASKERAPGAFRRWWLNRRIADAKGRALALAGRVDVSGVQDFVVVALTGVYVRMDEWGRARKMLGGVDDEYVQRHAEWWVSAQLDIYDKLGDAVLLHGALSRVDIRRVVPVKQLRRVIGAYLANPEFLMDALELQQLIVTVSKGAAAEVVQLSRMCAMAGDAASGLRLLQSLNMEQLPLADRLFRDFLWEQVGRDGDAYNDYMQIEFAHMLKLRYPQLDAQFYFQYANVCIKVGKVDRALQLAEKCCRMQPGNASFCNFLGYVLADENRELDKAESLVRKALEISPGNPAYIDSLAWVYFRRGDYRKALELMSEALRHGGLELDDDPEFASHFRQIFEKLGLPGAASVHAVEPIGKAP